MTAVGPPSAEIFEAPSAESFEARGSAAERQRAESAAERQQADVLYQYADVLRVGKVLLHGREITWETRVSNACQLKGFCTAAIDALRLVPELEDQHEDVLLQVAHMFCKALSINYIMAELMEHFRRKLGIDEDAKKPFLCSIRSGGESSHASVDYHMEVLSGSTIRARASWRGKNNIVSCNPKTGAIKVRGTLYHVETEFPIMIGRLFKPTYRLQTDLKQSKLSKFASSGPPVEMVTARTPLYFDGRWMNRRQSFFEQETQSSECTDETGDDKTDCATQGPVSKLGSFDKVQRLFKTLRSTSWGSQTTGDLPVA